MLFQGLRLPIICAPMLLVSGPALVTAARRAGIVGAMPAGNWRTHAEFATALDAVAGADVPPGSPPFAINLSLNARRRLGDERFEADLAACRRQKAPLVITSSGDPKEIVTAVHEWGGLVFHDVTTVAHARKAAAAGVDGLVLISAGGGGHSGRISPLVFVAAVRSFFSGTIVLGGAIASGEAILAAQALGADLCYMGTRFIATLESHAAPAYKEMLVKAGAEDVLYTPAFTRGVPANFLLDSIRANGLDPAALGDFTPTEGSPRAWRDIWSGGQSVALIQDVPDVAELVDRLAAEYEAAAARLAARTILSRPTGR